MFGVDVVIPAAFDCPTVEGIERAAAAGADGVEFFDWEGADLAAIRDAAAANGVTVAATLSAGAGSNVGVGGAAMTDPGIHERAVADVERSLDAAAELGARCLIVTVGPDQDGLDRETQHGAIVDVLADVAPAAEAAGVTVILEPLNARVDHPGYYLTSSYEGYEIVEAVDSPRVKLLFDVYHQQITEGDVTRNLRDHIDLVGHVHVADNPGRREPGTGELDYGFVLGAIADLDYDGFVGCEFSPTGDPDAAVREVVELADAARGRR